jgi:fructan beta-fructosidase
VLKKEISVDRSESGITSFNESFRQKNTMSYVDFEEMKIRVLYDHTAVEVFINDEDAITNLVFPNEVYNGLTLFSKGGTVTIRDLNIYSLSALD